MPGLEAGRRAWWAKPSSPPPTASPPAAPKRSWASRARTSPPSRYATDAAAAEALCESRPGHHRPRPGHLPLEPRPAGRRPAAGRTRRHPRHRPFAPATASRPVNRWYYRQRMEAVLQRTQRPWFILVDPGSQPAWQGEAGTATVQAVAVDPARKPASAPRSWACASPPPMPRPSGPTPICCSSPAPAGPRNRPTASRM